MLVRRNQKIAIAIENVLSVLRVGKEFHVEGCVGL